jgi:hypothetical protein
VDQARLVDAVFHAHAEALAHLGPDAEGAVRLPDPKHRRRLAVHLDAAARKAQHRRRAALCARARLRGGLRTREIGQRRRRRERGQEGTA